MILNLSPSHNIVFINQFKALVLTIRLEFHLIGMHTLDCTYCLVCENTTRKCTAVII